MKTKIVAIGGGEIADGETLAIDERIVALSGKANPKLLFIPTASSDSEDYFRIIQNYFTKLGCEVSALYLLKDTFTQKQLEQCILAADIIYVGGGNTLKMMTVWRKLGVDVILRKAQQKGIVLAGISAGAICWFAYGNSDSRKFTSNSTQLIRVTGLGLYQALLCPHFDSEAHRRQDLKRMMQQTPKLVAIALEDSAAIEIVGTGYRIIKSKASAKAYRVYWKGGIYHQETIITGDKYRPLSELLTK